MHVAVFRNGMFKEERVLDDLEEFYHLINHYKQEDTRPVIHITTSDKTIILGGKQCIVLDLTE